MKLLFFWNLLLAAGAFALPENNLGESFQIIPYVMFHEMETTAEANST